VYHERVFQARGLARLLVEKGTWMFPDFPNYLLAFLCHILAYFHHEFCTLLVAVFTGSMQQQITQKCTEKTIRPVRSRNRKIKIFA
jgi:hypothetical protein